MTLPRIGFVGAGRVARTLAQGFSQRGYDVVAVASRTPGSAQRLATEVAACRALDDAQEVVDAVDLVFLTVPDDAIAPAAASLAWPAGKWVVHASGATEVTALSAARARGAVTGGFHPLQTFADPSVALAGLRGCTVAIEAEGALETALEGMAAALGMRPIRLPPGARPLYHGAGSFAAPFVALMVEEAVRIWESFGVPREQALPALITLARGTLDAAARDGIAGSFAGPIARGDVGTIERHLAAMAKLRPETLALYREMARRAIPVAQAKGTLNEETAARLRALVERGPAD
jgi:predicted short-subunit dehydrogenase-like oxidoreductase (DUF2520 family)